MGFIGAFKKIGKGIAKGALTSGKVLAKIDDIPGAKTAIAMIPVAGPYLALAAEKCDMAESIFIEPGSAERKKRWARAQLRKELLKRGVEEKYIDDLIAVGFLVKEGVASVVGVDEDKLEKKKSKSTPKKEEVKDGGDG